MLVIIFVVSQRNTFQGILVTNYTRSFAIFTYFCGDLEFSNSAQIGFFLEDGFQAIHPATSRGPKSIACLNTPVSPWVNVVYEISAGENFNSIV